MSLQLMIAFCKVYCLNLGYDSGILIKQDCACIDLYDYEAIKSPIKLKMVKNVSDY